MKLPQPGALLIILGVIFLPLAIVNLFVVIPLHDRLASLEERNFTEQFSPVARTDSPAYRRLYEHAQSLRKDLNACQLERFVITGAAVLWLGVLFIIWGIDRRRLARRILVGSEPDTKPK